MTLLLGNWFPSFETILFGWKLRNHIANDTVPGILALYVRQYLFQQFSYHADQVSCCVIGLLVSQSHIQWSSTGLNCSATVGMFYSTQRSEVQRFIAGDFCHTRTFVHPTSTQEGADHCRVLHKLFRRN
jgi:hypothetical protein